MKLHVFVELIFGAKLWVGLDFANLPILQLVFASINYKGIYHYLSLAWCTSHDFTIIWSNLIFSYMFISHLASSVRSLRYAMCPYPWSPATPGCQSHQPHQRSATARFGSWHARFTRFAQLQRDHKPQRNTGRNCPQISKNKQCLWAVATSWNISEHLASSVRRF